MLLAYQSLTSVGMGELAISKEGTDMLTCIGLGSCIALCAYDPIVRIGGMAHMLLPSSKNRGEGNGSLVKYIDNGVPLLINRMMKYGARRVNLIVKIAGGAKMLSIPGGSSFLDVGQRNIAEIKAVLARENLIISGADLGGSFGRTVQFFVGTGRVTVRAVNGREVEL